MSARQGLGAAVHNASSGRAPVLLFAGLSPFTLEGEMRGSRTEYIHWIQDVPDQKQIVAQYCRYAAELKTGHNVKQMVNRALQFARSQPQGPVYLCGAREVMEMDIKPYSLRQEHWDPVELGGLPKKAVEKIATALAEAKEPLVITGYARAEPRVPARVGRAREYGPGAAGPGYRRQRHVLPGRPPGLARAPVRQRRIHPDRGCHLRAGLRCALDPDAVQAEG